MTEAERFLIDIETLFAKALDLVGRKNADYGNPNDPFANFKEAELVGSTVEQGILVRMSDKLRRASNLMNREAVVDESVEDTLIDLANYAFILAVWRRWLGSTNQ
jgi:hypothetical protein